MPSRNKAGCSCSGGETCLLFADNFDRADSSSLGADWTEVLGNWSIVSTTLRVASAITPAYLVSAAGLSQAEVLITWSFSDWVDGTVIRFLFDYVDTNNYYCAELTLDSSPGNVLRIIDRSGGTDTVLQTSTIVDDPTRIASGITLCYNGGSLTARSVNWPNELAAASPIGSLSTATPVFGLYVANPVTTSDVRFGDVEVVKVSEECEFCRPANCCFDDDEAGPEVCIFDEDGPPITLQLDMTGMYQDAGSADVFEKCFICGTTYANRSVILTNVMSGINPCFDYDDGPLGTVPGKNCILQHNEFFDVEGCQEDRQLCRISTTIQFVRHTSSTSLYGILVSCVAYFTHNPADPPEFPSCEDDPCSGSGGSAFLFSWFDWYTLPPGGLHAADIVSMSLTGFDSIAVTDCLSTSPECIIDFLS
jgi:hypothetical protein